MFNLHASLVLASSSPRRLDLLQSIGITPSVIASPDVDETPLKNEKPKAYCARVARLKAEAVHKNHPQSFVLAADTTVVKGAKILGKPQNAAEAALFLNKLSGARHSVYGAICLITPGGVIKEKFIETKLKFKRLSLSEIKAYVATQEYEGKAGGYAIQGYAAAFVCEVLGSYTNVVGLSLPDTCNLLLGTGCISYKGAL